ncbi:methyl-accepting chemotaxis protein [Acidihalobacter prosperus]
MRALLSTIKGRLTLASLLTAVLTFAAIGATLYLSNKIKVEFGVQSRQVSPLTAAVSTMTIAGLDGGSQLRTQVMAYDLNAKKAAALKRQFAHFDDTLKKAEVLARGVPSVAKKLEAIAQQWQPVSKMRNDILKAMLDGNYTGAIGMLPKENVAWVKLRADLHDLNQLLERQRESRAIEITQTIDHTWVWSTGLLFSAMIFGGGFLLLTIIGTVLRIDTLLKMMESIGAGDADLSQRLRVKGRDEMDRIAAAFNSFVDRIHDVIAKVAQSATQVSSASGNLSDTSRRMQSGAQQQQAETEQVAAAVNQMSATAQEVARNIEETSTLATSAAQNSQAGAQRASSAVAVVEELRGELAHSGQAVAELSQGVVDIGGIVDLINQIADQTNLLALNAAIEAARAGEQGRGFAVVAEEVRSLAQKTQDATGKIRDMIERVRQSAGSAVASMDATQARSQSAGEQVDLVASALTEVVGMVRDIADRAAQIATAAEQQSAVAEEINRNVSNIRNATEETVGAIEQSTTAANDLANLSSDLQRLVGQFRAA